MTSRLFVWASVTLLGLLGGGCATVTTGNRQDIAVVSQPEAADCILTRDGATIATIRTPGTVNVKRDAKPITVVCRKDNHDDNRAVMDSQLEGMTAGNLLIGGLVGVIVDAASGANSRYAPSVLGRLTPAVGGRPPAAAVAAATGAAPPVPAGPFDGEYHGGLSLTATGISAYSMREIDMRVAGGIGTGTVTSKLCGPSTMTLTIDPSGTVRGEIDVLSNSCAPRRTSVEGKVEGDRLVLQIEFKSASGPSRPIDFTLGRQLPRI
jgi:hypothetical protein